MQTKKLMVKMKVRRSSLRKSQMKVEEIILCIWNLTHRLCLVIMNLLLRDCRVSLEGWRKTTHEEVKVGDIINFINLNLNANS